MNARDHFQATQSTPDRWSFYSANVDRLSARLQMLAQDHFEFSDTQDETGRHLNVSVSNYQRFSLHMNKSGWFSVEEHLNDVDVSGLKTGELAFFDAALLLAAKTAESFPPRARAGVQAFLAEPYSKKSVTIAGLRLRAKF